MQPDAPLLHEDMFTAGVEPAPKTALQHRQAHRVRLRRRRAPASSQADVIVEREFNTKPVHQGYIEPHACIASVSEDGQADVWVPTQGHWIVRAHCARLLGWDIGKVRVTAAEIGGGFGGKTVVYLEPMALALSRKARRPVKMVMTREEVFRASGPTSGAHVRVKIGAKKDGRIVAGRGRAEVPGRRLSGLAGAAGLHVRLRALRPRERQGRRLRRGDATGRRSRPTARPAARSPSSRSRA